VISRNLRWYDYLTINIYYLGLTSLTQTMAPVVIPLLVQQFVGEARQGRYFGIMRLGALMAALLSQALMGMLSDHCMSRWGRRRPFILWGTLVCLLMVGGIGLTASLEGMTGFWVLFVVYAGQQIAANAAQSAEQSLIPDLTPPEKRGIFSGVKAFFEIPLPVLLASLTIAPFIARGNLWGGLGVMSSILLLTMLVTLLTPETLLRTAPPPLDWRPFLRLLLMTGAFTVIILLMGEAVKWAGRLLPGAASVGVQLVVMGGLGFVTMAVAIVAGVAGCFALSLGKSWRRHGTSFVWWVISRLAFLSGVTNLGGSVLYFLQARLGFTRETAAEPASRMMVWIGLCLLLSALPAGWLTNRFGARRLVMGSGLVATAGTVVTLFATNLTLVYVGGCLIGLATGVFYTASWALGTDLLPSGEAGRYLGLSNLAGAGAGAVGAYIGGPVADFFTLHVPDVPGLGYVLIFAIYGMLFVLSVVTLSQIRAVPVLSAEPNEKTPLMPRPQT